MKKIFGCVFVFVYVFNSYSVGFFCGKPDYFDPYCGLAGVTMTKENICNIFDYPGGESQSYKVYPGFCRNYPAVPVVFQDKIYKAFEGLFLSIESKSHRASVFLGEHIYTFLQTRLQQEYSKGLTGANLEKMAAMHYAASLIGPGYQFQFRK